MKSKISLIAICAAFFMMHIATSKKEVTPFPITCYDAMHAWFVSDSNRLKSARLNYNNPTLRDTIVCLVNDSTRNVNWPMVADSICAKVKRDCSKSGFPILIANINNPNTASWETKWGKTIVLKICN